MTTSSVLYRPSQFTAPILSGPRYSLVVSTEPSVRTAAQRLRHRVFANEPGFRLPDSGTGLDTDRFDEFCDHILVHDRVTGDVVGCYRMLLPEAAREAGGYYTATEFDLTALDPHGRGLVEMGRACVDPAHRSGSVLTLMWAGILLYLEMTGHHEVVGCVSVPLRTTPDEPEASNVRGVRDLLLDRHAIEPASRVRPLNPVVVDGHPLDEIAPPPRPVVPPLLRGYLRLGARICGEPAHDPDFGVADFVAILAVDRADARYLARLRAVAERNEGGAR
ncbi:GNAT family N-acetyltransferase [Rhodococcus sp. R1101]|uniref:GNAT family N-acetyltransferase n=1 Tax=Rhodococcus sp. R1101 TaxID=1170698 RepID=UPI00036374CE|nr:GNAT family N-acyltransferase [Rhodococcus sp. R1101]